MVKRTDSSVLQPSLLADFLFYISLGLFFFKDDYFLQGGALCVLYFGSRYIFSKVILSHNLVHVSNPNRLINFSFYSYFIVAVLVLVILLTGGNSAAYKISWTLDYPILSFLYYFLTWLVILNVIYILSYTSKFRIFILITLSLFVAINILFHSKGFFIVLIFSTSLYLQLSHKKISLKVLAIIGTVSIIVLFFFYRSDYMGLANRVVKSIEAVYILLYEGVDKKIVLLHDPLIYIFKFFFFKVGFEAQEIGQIIGQYSSYTFPAFGGPNDHILSYYLLDEFKVSSIIFIVFSGALVSIVDLSPQNYVKNYYAYIFLGFLYLNLPTLIQAPSNLFLTYSKFILLFLILIFIDFLMPKKKN